MKPSRLLPVLSLVLLAACSLPGPRRPPEPRASISPSPTVQATPTAPPSATSTPVPPTPTSSPTLTPEPPTATVAPTLTADQEQALALTLLQSNAGCRLPCWWGFTPGKTTWPTAQAFFASLGKATDGYGSPYVTYSVEFNAPKHNILIDQIYSVTSGTIDMIWVRAGTVRNHERIYGDPLFAQDLQQYMLPQMLAATGKPTKGFLETYASAPEGGAIPFRLLLFYPQQGILVEYQGLNEREGKQIRVCPMQVDIALWLWSPESQLTFEGIARANLGDLTPEEVPHYRFLEAVTGMSLETFYQTFKNPDSQTCLETPVDMWP